MNTISNDSLENKSQIVSKTDWDRLDAMTNKDIDTSDSPPLTEEFLPQRSG